MPPVLDAAVALDGRHDEAAEKTHHIDNKRDGNRLRRTEWRNRIQRATEQCRAAHPADGADDRFRRRQRRHNPLAAKELAPHKLQHVARLHHRHEKQQQQNIVVVAGNAQIEQRRNMRDAIDANHHRPLRRRRAREEKAAVAGKRGGNRHKKKGINRNKRGEQVEIARIHQHILQRQNEVITQHHHPVITAAAVHQREKLAQGKKRHQPEQKHRAAATDGKRRRQHRRHPPPRMNARAQIGKRRRRATTGDEPVRRAARRQQNQQHRGKQPRDNVLTHKPRSSCRNTGCSANNVAWAKARKSSFSGKSPPRNGWPKRTLHNIGTGSSLPLGRTR